MLKIKERGNDDFTVSCNSLDNLKMMVSKGYIKEVGQCLFLYNQMTELWEVFDARYVHLLIPDYPRTQRIWTALDTKRKLFSDRLKPVFRPPSNRIEIARDEMVDAINMVAERDMTYRAFYEYCQDYFTLPDFKQAKGRDDHE